jgi:hypothetical protein
MPPSFAGIKWLDGMLLPCQIALICHDSTKTISEISLETGIPAVYIEEEVELLLNAGVMISPTKDKYRTNLFILKKNAVAQIKEQFKKLFDAYLPSVIAAYDKYLPRLKKCDVYKQEATSNQWAWFFMDGIEDFDYIRSRAFNRGLSENSFLWLKRFYLCGRSKVLSVERRTDTNIS